MVRILGSGSAGNAVLYHNSILIDCGVPYSLIKPHIKGIQIVLLTHSHGDHINMVTLRKIVFERPTIRIGCCEWMEHYVSEFKNVDIFKIGEINNYGPFKIAAVQLYHDVKNCGYRIFKESYKTIHCTDTAHLEGITAKNYDLFCIESNYNEDTVFETIARIERNGGFAHQRGSIQTHLSEQQCNKFFYENKKEDSKLIRLHQTKTL